MASASSGQSLHLEKFWMGEKVYIGNMGRYRELSTGRFIQSVQFKQIPLPEWEEISLQTARKGSRNRFHCYLPLQLEFCCLPEDLSHVYLPHSNLFS